MSDKQTSSPDAGGAPRTSFTGSAFWDERFGTSSFAYGTEPNTFLAETLAGLTPGRALFVAEGEGRNAVYAAQLGWEVTAVDFSAAAREKALRLASERGVSVDYQLADVMGFDPGGNYDLIAFIFLHLPPDVRQAALRRYLAFLAPGGRVVAEVFAPGQLGRTSGGPKSAEWLISAEELRDTFASLIVERSEEVATTLAEGSYHEGPAAVARFYGQLK